MGVNDGSAIAPIVVLINDLRENVIWCLQSV
jgi:hypothetical protein